MKKAVLDRLCAITTEALALIKGNNPVDWNIYVQDAGSTINAKELLSSGKLITIRPYTRFLHFLSIPT